nr:MAG TPA: hypothetical protein [Ackermannviridae sp.]
MVNTYDKVLEITPLHCLVCLVHKTIKGVCYFYLKNSRFIYCLNSNNNIGRFISHLPYISKNERLIS